MSWHPFKLLFMLLSCHTWSIIRNWMGICKLYLVRTPSLTIMASTCFWGNYAHIECRQITAETECQWARPVEWWSITTRCLALEVVIYICLNTFAIWHSTISKWAILYNLYKLIITHELKCLFSSLGQVQVLWKTGHFCSTINNP